MKIIHSIQPIFLATGFLLGLPISMEGEYLSVKWSEQGIPQQEDLELVEVQLKRNTIWTSFHWLNDQPKTPAEPTRTSFKFLLAYHNQVSLQQEKVQSGLKIEPLLQQLLVRQRTGSVQPPSADDMLM